MRSFMILLGVSVVFLSTVAPAIATWGLKPGQASFAIGGSALLFPYYLGVLDVLKQSGYIVPGQTRFAGISGGAITAAATCAGIPPNTTLFYMAITTEQHARDTWVVRGDIIRGLSMLAPAGSFRACRGKVHIAMSELNKSSSLLNDSTTYVVSKFRSDDDFWGATVGSSSLSCAGYGPNVDPSLVAASYHVYRGRPVMDGIYANDLTTLCTALGFTYGARKSKCVGISVLEPGVFRKKDSAPPTSTAPTTSNPCGATQNAGAADRSSSNWALPTNCSAIYCNNLLPAFTDTFRLDGPWPAICPGCDPRNPLPFTRDEWQAMALDSSKAVPNLAVMSALGMRDAQLWVQNQTEALSGQQRR